MRVSLIIVLSIILNYSYPVVAQDNWHQKDSVNGPARASASAFTANGEGFIVGGFDGFEFKRKLYSYDSETDDWDNETSLGGDIGSGLNRGGAVAFSINHTGYVGLGQGNTVDYLSDFWAYDPETDSWTQMSQFEGSARRQAVAFVIDHIAYVGTGQDVNGLCKDFYAYDPQSNQWTAISDFAGTARKAAVGFNMGGQGYVGTGDDGVFKSDFWQYQPSTDEWIQKASFPGTARTGTCGWGIFPRAYLACGYDTEFKYKRDVWEYNYYSNTWQQRGSFDGEKRAFASVFVLDETAYIGLGYNGQYLDDFWAYEPAVLNLVEETLFQLRIYPNPANNEIQISGSTDEANQTDFIELSLFNIQGQLVFHQTVSPNEKISLNDLEKGIYLYQLNDLQGGILQTGRFIKA